MKINNCLKEWNVIVEALGQGKQTVLIRSYETKISHFLLYPTSQYTKRNVNKSFSEPKMTFVNSNLLPFQKDDKILIKYFIKIEDIIEVEINSLDKIQDNFLWNMKHVKKYLRDRNAFVWLVRVYELEEPKMVEKSMGIRYAKINEFVNITNSNPVLEDNEYSQIIKKIIAK